MPGRNASPSLRAGGALTTHSFAMMSSTADNTCLQATANAPTIGITQVGSRDAPGTVGASANAAVAAGDAIELFSIGDICDLRAGSGGWARGQELVADTNGDGIVSTPGATGQFVGATALESCAAGEIGRVQVCRYVRYA